MRPDPFPPDEQRPEPVVPADGPLDDPPTRLATDTADQRGLAPAADEGLDAAGAHGGLRIGVVVPFVEAEVLRTPRPPGSPHDDRIERGRDVPCVVDVGGGDLGGQRDAASVSQEVALDPALGAVRGVRPRLGPPFGAFTIAVSRAAQRHWIVRFRS